MPFLRAIAWLVPFPFALIGCAGRTKELVTVDLSQLGKSSSIQVPPSKGGYAQAGTSQNLTVPGSASETIRSAASASELALAKQTIDRNREKAISEVAAGLREAYRHDIDKLLAERLNALSPEFRSGLAKAIEAVRAGFLNYAGTRGKLVARLALMADFPDKDPQSLKQAAPDDRHGQQRLEEAKQLRRQVAELDRSWRAKAQQIADQAESKYFDELTNLRVEIEELRDGADIKALSEARRQVFETLSVKSIFEGGSERQVKGEPTISARVDLPAVTRLPPALDLQNPTGQQKVLQSDLKVWAATKNYVLVDSGGRDATKEFEIWRRERKLGP